MNTAELEEFIFQQQNQAAVNHQHVEVSAPSITRKELVYEEKIGQGCFGEVYKGTCRGQPCAIKTLTNFDFSREEAFKSEVEIMCQNANPYSVLCLGAMTEVQPWAMVTQFMQYGDLDQCLHSGQHQIPPDIRLRMCFDISLGMSWLYGEKSRTLHRDLKPANSKTNSIAVLTRVVLVDENWHCKIADYGVSYLMDTKNFAAEKNLGKKDEKGSRFWTSPEALRQGGTVTEKSDVYSFALILWEVTSEVSLGTEYAAYLEKRDEYAEAINNGLRPNLELIKPPFDHPSFIDHVKKCWHQDPEQRPTFAQVVKDLSTIKMQIFLPTSLCPDAASFWELNFSHQTKVSIPVFLGSLYKYLDTTNNSKDRIKTGLTQLFEARHHHNIELTDFAHLLYWFGPLKGNGGLVNRILSLMKLDWFFGLATSTQADLHLKHAPPGERTLVSESPFTISFLNEDGDLLHTRVYRDPEGTLKSEIFESGAEGENIVEIIEVFKAQRVLKEPCPGSPFHHIWHSDLALAGSVYLLPKKKVNK